MVLASVDGAGTGGRPWPLRGLVALGLAVLALPWLAASAAESPAPTDAVSFHRQIRPIFQARCQGCHQPARAEGGYVMTSVARLRDAGDSGTAGIVPGQPDAGELLRRITPDADGKADMPREGKPLAATEIDLLRRWIAAGAIDDSPASAGQVVDADHPPVYTRQPVITSLDFSPDGRLLAVSGFHEVLLFDVSAPEAPAAPLRRLVGLAERVERVRFSPDGTLLAVTGGNPARQGEVQIWSVADGTLVRSAAVTFDTVFGGSWSPDGKTLAFGCADNSLRAIDVATGTQVLYQGAHEDWVLDTVFSPKGDHVISVGRDMSVKLTELATQRFVDNVTSITPGALRGGLAAVDRHPTLDQIVAAGADGTPRVYRIHRHAPRVIGDDANLIFPLFPISGRALAVRFSADGRRIAAAGGLDGQGELVIASYDYDADVPKPILDVMAKVPGETRRKGTQRSDEEWKRLDDYRDQGTREVARVALPGSVAYAVAFHPGGREVAVGGADGIVRFFATDGGAPGRSFAVARIDEQVAADTRLPLPWPGDGPLEAEPAPPAAVTGLALAPAAISLVGPFASAQVVVTGRLADGTTIDLSRAVRYEPLAGLPVVAGAAGLLRPTGDGAGTVRVTWGDPAAGGLVADLPVDVSGVGVQPTVDFIRDVNPVLSRLGCNQGTCHGAAKGKNGFKLSLRGYDALFDVRAFTDDHGSRRVNVASPDDSLMLLKASAAAPHGGGQLATPDQPAYQLVRRWIQQGAKLDESVPRVTGIEVFPAAAVIDLPGRRQQFRVTARYADGTVRDVTREAFLESGNNEVATADRTGLVTAVRRGEAPILARYEGAYAAVTLTVMGDRAGFQWSSAETWGPIDELVAEKWQALQIEPAPLCSDDEFLRRVTLDLTGLPPTAPQVRSFLADRRDTRIKRAELVSRLVASEAFVDHWTNKWADLLQVNPKFLGAEGAQGLRAWIRGRIAANAPYDVFAREILTATGSNRERPEAAYYKVLRDPLLTMENTTHLFLGVRFNCNKCHDHPFERWTQDQYYETAAFFAQVGLERDPESKDRTIGGTAVEGAKPLWESVVDRTEGDVTHERTGKVVAPKFPFECRHDAPSGATRRQQLAAWITSPDNPYFARSYVNRLWGYLFGIGIIEPIDDIRAGNPPTNPALLDHLTRSFIDGGFDIRRVLTEICTSRTYGLSIAANRWNTDDKVNFSHVLPRRLPAETLFDAVHTAIGAPTKFPGYPVGTRAAQLPDVSAQLGGGFLQTFGRPTRESACECERSGGLSLGPVMALVSGPAVGDVLADPGSELSRLVAAEPDDARLVDEVFLRILNRPSRPEERQAVGAAMAEIGDDHAAVSAELAAAEAAWMLERAELERQRGARIAAARGALETATAAYEPKRIELERARADRIAAALAATEAIHGDPEGALSRYEAAAATAPRWRVIEPVKTKSRAGSTLVPQADGSILVSGKRGDETTTLTFRVPAGAISGLRLEALADPSLPRGGAGRADDGNFVVTELSVDVAPASDPNAKVRLEFGAAKADFEQQNFPASLAVDKDPNARDKGWAVAPRLSESHWAVFETKERYEMREPSVVTVTIDQKFNGGTFQLGRFRISLTDTAAPLELGLPAALADLLVVPRGERSPGVVAEIDRLVRDLDPERKRATAELAAATLPLPPDPGLVALAEAIRVAERPVPDDPAIVRLRGDVEASTKQLADKRLTAIQDLAWALINSPAFFFNH